MAPAEATEFSNINLPRVLGPFAALCVVVGSVIGSGIFLVPAKIASDVPFMSGIIMVWVIGGLFSGAGALTLAELGAMLPRAGGPYVYLRLAYGSLPAFLFGWVEFLIVRSGAMATLAAAFARYFAGVAPSPPQIPNEIWQGGAATAAIAFVIAVNVMGARGGGALQVMGTVLKVGGIIGLIALPFLLGAGAAANFAPIWPATVGGTGFFGVMAAMVSVLWAYDGWTAVTPLAEEIKDPGRNIPRSLIWGMVVLIALYLSMTLAYHFVLSMGEIASASSSSKDFGHAVAALYCDRLLGRNGVVAISVLVMCSTFIALNGNALAGPRAYFAMARDGLLPSALGRVSDRFQTPANAILAQGIWAIILTIAGTALTVISPDVAPGCPRLILDAWKKLNETPLYDLLYTYVIFGANLFYMLAISSVFVFRVRQPELVRPYRTWGYPLTPLIYIAGAVLLLGSMLADHQSRVQSIAGIGIILLGLPGFWIFRRRTPASSRWPTNT